MKKLIGHCEDCGKKLYEGDKAVCIVGEDVFVCAKCLEDEVTWDIDEVLDEEQNNIPYEMEE